MLSEMQDVTEAHMVEFEEFMILKNFSKRTIKTYMQIVRQFVGWFESFTLG
jgi:hypothetical protein